MKKGITIMALSTIIAVTIILSTVVIISTSSIMESVNKTRFVTELLNIQDAVSSYKSNNGTYPEVGVIQVNLPGDENPARLQFSKEKQNENQVYLYLIDYTLIDIDNKIFGNRKNEKDVYAFSKETGIVYYIQGIKYKGKIYYTVTEEITDISNITLSLNKNEVKKLDLIFIVSNITYTNKPISVDIKFPINAEEINITTTNENISCDTENTIVNGYKFRGVNKTLKQDGNYYIIVSYSINRISKQVKYEVRNFDNEPPAIDISQMQEYNVDGNTYLTNINVTDNVSGIKQIKYELEEILDEDIDYFYSYGTIFNDTKINIRDKKHCTIYAIDNAGNKSMVRINTNDE